MHLKIKIPPYSHDEGYYCNKKGLKSDLKANMFENVKKIFQVPT